MPSFRYESLTASGQTRQGVVAAASRGEAVRLLGSRGETPTVVEAVESSNGEAAARPNGSAAVNGAATAGADSASTRPGLFRSGRRVVSRSEMANLIRELATALEAGLPLMQALRTVRRTAKGAGMIGILDHFIARVEAGAALHIAAREYGPPFDDLVVGMLRAADASGKTTDVLHQLADLLERSLDLRREVIGATLYPMIVAGLVMISAVILVTVLVPRLIEPLAGEMTMPLPTRILVGMADFLESSWYLCLMAIAAVAIAWRWWIRLPGNRLTVDRMKLRAPIFGQLLRDIAVSRFTRTLGTLVSAGIPIIDALRITRDTLGNAAMMQAIDDVQERVTSGSSLADPLERSGLFPPLLIQVVNLGERSGRLDYMLMHAAGAFDRQVNNSIKLFTRALPPLLIMVMAGLGGFVLAAIMLPLLELQSAIG
ncbi:MAG: type II secretion system F family protein [Planctomycetota bacterium]|nr:MAG: type II secretion system F family protein [Planctomycetota bacterium]